MNMNVFYMAIEETGHRPENVAFKCDKERPATIVVTSKKTDKVIGYYDTVTRQWL